MQRIPGNNRFLSTENVGSTLCDDNILKLLPDAGLLNHAKSANERPCALEPARTEQNRSYISCKPSNSSVAVLGAKLLFSFGSMGIRRLKMS